jgi:probable blue pigment (indigoidine) exporter
LVGSGAGVCKALASQEEKEKMKNIFTGLTFSILWASAGIAGKFGLRSAEPLVLFTSRFFLAGAIMLIIARYIRKERSPTGQEWQQLFIYGLFNTALYLGIFIVALQYITAGITALAIALNPILISIMSSIIMKRKTLYHEWISITLGMGGVALAAYPLLTGEEISLTGMGMLMLSMLTYSYGSVYYSSISWTLPRMVINGWQVLMGGLMLLPFAVIFYKGENKFDLNLGLSLLWLVVPVSILSVQLWLRLLKADAVKASLWLFLCPVSGISFSTWLLDEPFTWYTGVGAVLVLGALWIGQRGKLK